MMNKIVFLLAILLNLNAWSQSLPGVLDEFRLLEFQNQLPEDLLSSRSAVYIQVPNLKGKYHTRGDWKMFATEAHEGFKRMGIDVVAYYNWDDINSGLDARTGFINPLNSRKIKNLIFINKKETILGTKVELTITKRETESLLNLNQTAYNLKRNALGEIVTQLGRDIYANKLVNTNFLILDKPEFFTDTDAVKGRRYESFNRDLKIGKLAVPLFAKYNFKANIDSTALSTEKLALISRYNQEVEKANQRLREILEIYPYKYELVDYAQGEEHLYRREFSYVLMFLHSSGRTIKELLNYDVDYNETDYITLKTLEEGVTVLEQYPMNTPVYKFYMKQLVNKEVYLGSQWDADLTWEAALFNHLNNFKEAQKSKNN